MALGKLYVVAGPIGNLNDITLRALEVLKEVTLIISEDTRETAKLLLHYNITTPQISYRDQNHQKALPKVLEVLESGADIALVSDSGTPLISDPGYKLVSIIREKGIEVKPVPGPSAVIAGISVSGLPTDKFVFLGFLPKTKSQRKAIIGKYGELDATICIYEAPYRVEKLLNEIFEVLGDRKVSIQRELTKMFEEIRTDNVLNIIKNMPKLKGEFLILIAKENYE